ncbi:MAG: HAD family phosphatase [Lachnospiraceae bacterium]|nr:HAD family phosphatase [Lachnospiraceae bacterium]
MIKTVIFDIGNVLVDYNWRGFFEQFDLEPEIFDRLSQASVLNEDWNEFDRGVLSTEEVLALFRENDPEIAEVIDRVFENARGLVTKRDYAIPWMKKLHAGGYQVLVLSNFSQKVLEDCSDAMDFLPYTDGGILSYREKVIKPMPEIYERLIAQNALVPEECVFLDDLQQNLDGAAAFGIQTILFTTKEQAEEELKKLGVAL